MIRIPFEKLVLPNGDIVGLGNAIREGSHIYQYHALASRVLLVASAHEMDIYGPKAGAWTCYCDSVPGMNHENEWRKVKQRGTKILQPLAETFFPTLAKAFQWRS